MGALMCCRSSVQGIPDSWLFILEIAGFRPLENKPDHYTRNIGENNWVTARHIEEEERIRFELWPNIGTHSLEQHQANATSAAVMFKTAMTLAERGNGEMIQEALVAECHAMNGGPSRVLAVYPNIPLTFDRLCLYFQDVLMHGIRQGDQ